MATRTTDPFQPGPRRDVSSEVAYLTRALKAPTLRESVARLAERACAEGWSHEEYLIACLQREVSARVLIERTSVGLDVHARSVVACGIDGVTGEVHRARLCPDTGEIMAWVRGLPGPWRVV